MKTKRAMILVSNDPESIRLGANELVKNLTEALAAYDLNDEVEIATLNHVEASTILPMMLVYPEAVVYGPVKPEDARYLVEEHLCKGSIVENLVAPPRQLGGKISWLRGH